MSLGALTLFVILSMPLGAPHASSGAQPARAADRLLLSVSPRVVMAGHDVRTHVRVDRHVDNRLLRVLVEGPQYAASAERQLDGDVAERTHERLWSSLPAGLYTVTVEVEGARGLRHRVTQRLTVTGLEMDVANAGDAATGGPQPVPPGNRCANCPGRRAP